MKNSKQMIENLITLISNEEITELTLSHYTNEPQASPGHIVFPIYSYDLDDEDMELLASLFKTIKNCSSLKRLNFYHLNFEGKPYAIFDALLEMIMEKSSLESLHFENCIIGICHNRACMHPCEHVDYQRINLSRFLDALSYNISIRSLKLSNGLFIPHAEVSENVLKKFAEWLIKQKIENLSLPFTSTGLALNHVVKTLMTNDISLKSLELAGVNSIYPSQTGFRGEHLRFESSQLAMIAAHFCIF